MNPLQGVPRCSVELKFIGNHALGFVCLNHVDHLGVHLPLGRILDHGITNEDSVNANPNFKSTGDSELINSRNNLIYRAASVDEIRRSGLDFMFTNGHALHFD